MTVASATSGHCCRTCRYYRAIAPDVLASASGLLATPWLSAVRICALSQALRAIGTSHAETVERLEYQDNGQGSWWLTGQGLAPDLAAVCAHWSALATTPPAPYTSS